MCGHPNSVSPMQLAGDRQICEELPEVIAQNNGRLPYLRAFNRPAPIASQSLVRPSPAISHASDTLSPSRCNSRTLSDICLNAPLSSAVNLAATRMYSNGSGAKSWRPNFVGDEI